MKNLAAACLALLMGASQEASSLTWYVQSDNPLYEAEYAAGQETPRFQEGSYDATTRDDPNKTPVTVTGWTENPGRGDSLKQLGFWSGTDAYSDGMRITPSGEPALSDYLPLDNDASGGKGRDAIVYSFLSDVILQHIDLQWARECKREEGACKDRADVEVWYFKGAGDPTAGMAGNKYDSLLDGAADGWNLLGHYKNQAASGNMETGGDIDLMNDGTRLGAPVAATHFLFAPALTTSDGHPYDYVKVAAVSGTLPMTTTTGRNPSPAPLFLLALGLPLVSVGRRSRRKDSSPSGTAGRLDSSRPAASGMSYLYRPLWHSGDPRAVTATASDRTPSSSIRACGSPVPVPRAARLRHYALESSDGSASLFQRLG